jgi:hypothetical protein
MDLNAFDFDLDLETDSDLADLTRYRRSTTANAKTSPAATTSVVGNALASARAARSLTNSPGCAPAPTTPALARVLRKVRTDAWSAPASVSWARPSRALRKVARRAVEGGMNEPA